MATACESCGAPLGISRRLMGKQRCERCEASGAPARGAAAPQPTPREALRQSLRAAIANDRLSEEDESGMASDARAAGLDQAAINDTLAELASGLAVARVNAGRMSILIKPTLTLRRGEVAYLEGAAMLVKEEGNRGIAGAGFHIARGARYPASRMRGRSIRSRGALSETDAGKLTITSQRVVFTGRRENIDTPITNVVTMTTYDDGIQLQLSDRRSAPIFKLSDGHLVAATINTAVQRKL